MPRSATRPSPTLLILGCLAACWLLAAADADADWLVTNAGERIETRGGWQVKGRMVVFTQPSGTLSSIRLSEVDLDASATATEEAAAAAAAPASEPAPAARPARVITNDDVGEAVPGAESGELLIERLRQAHALQDVGLAIGLVDWQDAPDGARDSLRTRFEQMMERRLRNIRFVEIEPENFEEQDQQEPQDEVSDDPGFELAGKLELEFFRDPGQAKLAPTLQVGTRLGSYFIVAPREVQD